MTLNNVTLNIDREYGGLRIDMGILDRPATVRGTERRRKFASGPAAALAALLVISGCSSVPDYANPVEWYKSTVDLFDDDVPPPVPAKAVPGASDPFPELSAVPEPPLREIELSNLKSVGVGLIADRANAQYTDSVIRAGGDTALAEAAPLPMPVSPLQSNSEAPMAPSTEVSETPVFQTPPLQPAPAPVQAALPPQAAPQQLAFRQLRPVDRGIDVKNMFANLFSSSGPRGIAPANIPETALLQPSPAYTSTFDLSSNKTLIAPGGQLDLNTLPLLGSNKAAVIYFKLGSASISKDGYNALHKVADFYKKNGGSLRVVGHASNRTKELSSKMHELVNFNISFKRACAVADELIRSGVSPNRVEVVAMSANDPAFREWMPSGEAGNRRAEVFIVN